jgi:tetratricopeptide (TPR) repeat protein
MQKIALLSLLWLGPLAGASASPWIEITSDDFVLISDLPERKARTLLRDFEVFQFAASRLTSGADMRPRIPTYLLALGSRDFGAVVEGRDIAGEFYARPFANYIVYEHAQRGTRGREIVFHEYLHFLIHNSPGYIYPAWYNEGIAELYSTVTERNGLFNFGRVPTERAHTIAYLGFIPTKQVLEIDYRSPDFRSHRLLPQFYAQSWLMAHYLMIGNQARAKRVTTFLEETNKGASPADATRAAFGIYPDELHRELERYWKVGKLPIWRIEFADPVPTVEDAPLRTLPESEAQALVGYAALRKYGDARRAERFFARALKGDPADPIALAGTAMARDTDGRTDEATALLERALARSGSASARLLAADVLLTRAARGLEKNDSDSDGRASGLRARELYQALLSDPAANNEAAYGYARAAILLEEPKAAEVLTVVRQATARLSTNTELAKLEAVLSWKTGDLAEASSAASRAARYASSFEERKAALSMVEKIQKQASGAAGDQ